MQAAFEPAKRNGSTRLRGLLPDGRRTVETAREAPSRKRGNRSPRRIKTWGNEKLRERGWSVADGLATAGMAEISLAERLPCWRSRSTRKRALAKLSHQGARGLDVAPLPLTDQIRSGPAQ